MKKKVLIVDDKEAIAKIVTLYLRQEYETFWFENPGKAIEWINCGNIPDLIISDIKMPVLRGDEFLRKMKSHELYKCIPFVMLSSEDSTTERVRLLSEGAEDYIVKPFNPMELKVRIRRILE
ncbi:MAG: response regulator transcription factor [Bacteroidales bacterium]